MPKGDVNWPTRPGYEGAQVTLAKKVKGYNRGGVDAGTMGQEKKPWEPARGALMAEGYPDLRKFTRGLEKGDVPRRHRNCAKKVRLKTRGVFRGGEQKMRLQLQKKKKNRGNQSWNLHLFNPTKKGSSRSKRVAHKVNSP